MGALVALLVLGVALAVAYANSTAGEARIRRLVDAAAQDALAGSVTLGGFELNGRTVILRDLHLTTPEGEPVATVGELRARLSLLPLLRHTVRIDSVELLRPSLTLVQDERGLNLSRAIAPRHPSPTPAPSEPSAWSVDLSRLSLEGGAVSFQHPGGQPENIAVTALSGQGAAWVGGGDPGTLRADLTLRGAMTQPVQGPVSLAVQARGEGAAKTLTLTLDAPGFGLTVGADLSSADRLDVSLQRLTLSPSTARAFLPTYPLRIPLELKGSLQRRGAWDTVALTADAGSAHLTADGTLDLAQLEARALSIHGEGLDLLQLTGKGPTTDLAFELEGNARGTSLDTLSGALKLTVPASRAAGQPLGPLSLQARAKNGQVTIDTLRARLPGVSLQGGGTASMKSLDLRASVNATDLAAIHRTFGSLTGTALPKLSGSGDLSLRLRGPTRHPSLTVQGTVKSLQSGTTGVRQLQVEARVPDLRRPLEADASLSAAEVVLGGERLKDLSTSLKTQGRRLIADFRSRGDAELWLHVEGPLDANGRGLTVDTLTLSWPEETWRLQKPAHVVFAGPTLSVAPLTLHAGAQRLFVEGSKTGGRIRAVAAVSALSLQRLPAILARRYQLDGTLNADLRVEGRLSKPTATAQVTLEDGSALGYSGLSLTLDGRYTGDRAAGTLRAQGYGAALEGQFDLPLSGLRARRRVPVALDLTVAQLSVGDVLCQLARAPSQARLCPEGKPLATGSASAALHLSGNADRPELSLTVNGAQLQTGAAPASDVTLTVRNDAQDALNADLQLSGLGGSASVEVESALLLGDLLARPPTPAQLQRIPLTVSLHGKGLALGPLAKSGLLPRRVQGTLGFEGTLHGTALAPLGELTADVAEVKLANAPPLALALQARATDGAVTAHLTATQSGKALAELRAEVQRSLGALRDPKTLPRAPFHLELSAGPLSLEDDALYTQDEPHKDQQIHGTLTLAVGASGTLGAPEGTARLTADSLGVGPHALGHGEVSLRYADAKAVLEAALQGAQGGTLKLDARTQVALPVPGAAPSTRALSQAPVTAALQARGFDLSFLSGLTSTVRTVEGKLEADATASGTLGSPALRGALEWKDGALAVTGFGEYHGIHLALNATNDQIALRDVTLESGGGTLQLSATANHAGDRWRLQGKGEARNFPVVSDDQLVATATLRTTFDGEATSKQVTLQHLDIPEAHFELPQVARKDLQSLQRPADVVLLRDGRMVDKAKRRDPLVRADLRTVLGKGAQLAPLPPETAPVLTYSVTVNAPRNVWIKGDDVNAEIGFSEGFRLEYSDRPQLFGEVRVLRARLDVLGRRFDLKKDSTVRFAGEPLTPFVNVTGIYKNDPAQVTVYLVIRGQGRDLTLHVTSDPPLSESQIYTLLATGRITLKRGSGAAMSGGQAASIVGSLAAAQLKKSLASKLPLDVLSIEAGEEGLQGSKLEAGTYITDKAYVGYTGRLGADPSRGENSNAVKFEYQLSPHWSLEMEYGDARAGGADLIWSKDY